MTPRKTKSFGAALQALREGQGLSMRALAEVVGINAAHIMRLEHDEKRPTGDMVRRIAKALHADVEDLQALAAENLPRLAPYLRAKYDLNDEAIAELEEHFKAVSKRGRQ